MMYLNTADNLDWGAIIYKNVSYDTFLNTSYFLAS